MSSWQDYVFSAGGAFFSGSLIPMLRNKMTVVPRATSVPTACFLGLFVLTHISLGLYMAASTEAVATALWAAIAVYRGPAQARRNIWPNVKTSVGKTRRRKTSL